jgi:biotin transport system substrate-specific component
MPMVASWTEAVARSATQHRSLVLVVGVCAFAGATALAAQVRVPLPFSPVPVTLQTLLVLLSGLVLGAGAGAVSQGLYVALGAAGLPIFAGAACGLGGPTTGYLLAFPLAAALVGCAARRRSRVVLAAGLLAATMCIYTLGAGWLALGLGKSLTAAVMLGVVPFVWGDALKLAAVWCVAGLRKQGEGQAGPDASASASQSGPSDRQGRRQQRQEDGKGMGSGPA